MVTLGEPVRITYRNYRGETAQRVITPQRVWFGSTEWHPEPQWLMAAFDHEKQANRDFAIKDFGYPAPSPRAQALEFPTERVNMPEPDSDARIIGFRIREGDKQWGRHGLYEPMQWLNDVQAAALSSRPVADRCKTVDDGRPCSMDEFMSALFNEKVDEFDVSEAAASWVYGDWKDALSYLTNIPTHWRPLPASPGASE